MTTKPVTGIVLIRLLAAMVAVVVLSSSARASISARDQQALAKADLVYIATVRKNGTQSKAAPVWFTTGTDSNSILIQTDKTTWKAQTNQPRQPGSGVDWQGRRARFHR
jgi:predicted pyridoxine 5'-phosphate oxidase superfamily flavin-nucleotide-binding protein